MSERIKDAFNVQMAVPAWSLITALAMGIFAAGAIYQKLNTLVDNYSKTADRVSSINDRQIQAEASVSNIQMQEQNHEARITALERSSWEKSK